MIASCLLALLSYWHKNPLQIFAYLSGVALATALWSGVQAINLEAKVSYKAAAETLGEGQYDIIQPKQDKTISTADYVSLRKSGWLVSPVVDGYLHNIRLVGMDPLTLPSSFLFAKTDPELFSLLSLCVMHCIVHRLQPKLTVQGPCPF